MKEGWEYKKLEEICTKGSSNISLNKIEDNNGEYPLYGASGFVKGIDFYHQTDSYIGIVKDGSGVGRVNIYPPMSSLVGTMQYIFPKNNCILSFLKYLLQGLHLEKFKTGAAIPHIYFKDYGKTNVLIPPLSEQQHIVEELDLLSSIIEKKKAQLKELDNLAQSIFYEMFGDPITNEKGWDKEKMNNLCTITSSKRIFANEYCEEGVPFYRGKEITELSKDQPLSTELNISQKRFDELKKEFGVPSIGDILITAVGTIGNIWVVSDDREFYFKDGNIIWLKDIKGFNPVFFRKLLSILIDAFKSEMAQGCAYNALTIVNLKRMKALCPPLPLQELFASKIQSIEHQKALIKQSITEVETLFNSRMDYYFN